MNLWTAIFGRRGRRPSWATSRTIEAAVLPRRRGANIPPEQRYGNTEPARGRNSLDPLMLRAAARALNEGRPYWFTAAGELVHQGDTVSLAVGGDSWGRIVGPGDTEEYARVTVLRGPGRGQVRDVRSDQMRRRLNR